MDDYKIIIYIVLAILYFLFSGKKKSASKNTPPINQNPEPRNTPPAAEPKPVFQKPKPLRQNPVPEPKNQPAPAPQPFSLEDILKEFDQTLEGKLAEKTREREEVKAKVQEQPVRKILDYDEDIKEEIQSMEIPSLVKAKESASQEEHFTPYSLDGGKRRKYAEMFKDPESIRAAFVAAEIFNRKY